MVGRPVYAAVVLLLVPLAGCIGGLPHLDASDIRIVWGSLPVEVAPGEEFQVSYRIEGASGTIPHSGLHFGPRAVPLPGTNDDYPEEAGVQEDVRVPGAFSVLLAAPASGRMYMAAHAVVNATDVWSEERIVRVAGDIAPTGDEGALSPIRSLSLSVGHHDEGGLVASWRFEQSEDADPLLLEVFNAPEPTAADDGLYDGAEASVRRPDESGSVRFDPGEGVWYVRVRVTDASGEEAWSPQVRVDARAQAPEQPLSADAGDDVRVADSDGDGEEQVRVNGSRSAPADRIASYSWTRGDEVVAEGAAPTLSLPVGVHTLRLTVADDAGGTDSDSVQVTVVANRPPQAHAGADRVVTDSDGDGRSVVTLDGSASSDEDGSITAYAWVEGGEQIGIGVRPSIGFDVGDHIVTLVVSDNGGASDEDTLVVSVRAQSANASPTARFTHSCDALACTFDGRSSSDPDGGTLTYAWDFGDEGTGTGPQVQHTYAAPGGYTVTLRVTDPQGAAGTASRAVAVAAAENAPPVAAFTHACDALACTFDGSSSSDPEGGALTHAWDFGDGSQGSGATPSHTYAAPGTYHVVLTVEDPDGATDTEEKDVTASAPNGAPKPAYTESCDELDCSFDASASSDPDGDALTYTWDFGDGTTGAGATPTHTFPSSGTYVVELTATDDKGATASTSKSIAVAVDMPPVASFTHACEVRNCTFDGTGSSDPEGGALTYAWDFGNGATGEGPTPEVEYADAGTYVVSLIVTDPKGKTGTASTNVTIAS